MWNDLDKGSQTGRLDGFAKSFRTHPLGGDNHMTDSYRLFSWLLFQSENNFLSLQKRVFYPPRKQFTLRWKVIYISTSYPVEFKCFCFGPKNTPKSQF